VGVLTEPFAEPLDFRTLWEQSISFDAFVAASSEYGPLWRGLHAIARPPAWALEAAPAAGSLRFLVLLEDWCGDASNTIPMLAKYAEAAGIELRVLRRDEYPEVMDRYLTNGSRSIPVVIFLDGTFNELGHWGPRPGELQDWVIANRGVIPKAELYPQVRKWYARDRGETTLREVLTSLRS
jgi:hypothetical protein